jgi:hypothetical protein
MLMKLICWWRRAHKVIKNNEEIRLQIGKATELEVKANKIKHMKTK